MLAHSVFVFEHFSESHDMPVDVFEHAAHFLQVSHCEQFWLCHSFVDLLHKVLLKVTHSHGVEPVEIQVLVTFQRQAQTIPLAVYLSQRRVVQKLSELNLFWPDDIFEHVLLHFVFEVLQNMLAVCHALVELNLHFLEVLVR